MKKKYLNSFLLIIFSLIFLYSLYHIINYYLENKKINKEVNNIKEIVKIKEIDDGEKISDNVKKEDLYWKYINTKLIDVDFKKLKEINKNTVGWIQVLGTNINYPFVQYKDNNYYLTHSFDNSYNSAGWVFLDYRNNLNNDKNTILYAHGRLDKTMFGSLKNILTSDWLKNTNNYVVRMSTENEDSLWQVFSIYHVPTTSDYLQINFDDDFLGFSNNLLKRSAYNFKTTVSNEDRILTLSTCYNDNEKMVMHAKLIKKYDKKKVIN